MRTGRAMHGPATTIGARAGHMVWFLLFRAAMSQQHSVSHSDFYPVLRISSSGGDIREALHAIETERSRALTIAIVTIVALLGIAFGFLYLLMTQPAPFVRHASSHAHVLDIASSFDASTREARSRTS